MICEWVAVTAGKKKKNHLLCDDSVHFDGDPAVNVKSTDGSSIERNKMALVFSVFPVLLFDQTNPLTNGKMYFFLLRKKPLHRRFHWLRRASVHTHTHTHRKALHLKRRDLVFYLFHSRKEIFDTIRFVLNQSRMRFLFLLTSHFASFVLRERSNTQQRLDALFASHINFFLIHSRITVPQLDILILDWYL